MFNFLRESKKNKGTFPWKTTENLPWGSHYYFSKKMIGTPTAARGGLKSPKTAPQKGLKPQEVYDPTFFRGE